MLVLDDEDHVEAGQDGGHEVNVVLPLRVVPATEHRVGGGQNGAAGVQGGGDARLRGARMLSYHGNRITSAAAVIYFTYLSDGDGLLLHSLMDRHPVIFSHLGDKNTALLQLRSSDS